MFINLKRPARPVIQCLGLLHCLILLTSDLAGGESGWQSVPLRTSEAKAKGIAGGEGGQWPQGLAISGDGEFLLFGTDVGGIYRSLDGGDHWEPCNVGYNARGNCGFAIDPHNPDRCVAVAANSVAHGYHGIYLSTNRAASWRQVLPARIRGFRDIRVQLAYDPTSFDRGSQMTRTVYWSRTAVDPGNGNPKVHSALYRSLDGGVHWNEVPNSSDLGGCALAVHPTSGVVLAAGPKGFFRWDPANSDFEQTFSDACASVTTVRAVPDRVLMTSGDQLYVSRDGGSRFQRIESSGLPSGEPLHQLAASPADPDRLLVWADGGKYNWKRYVSHDEGRSWQEVKIDSTDAFLPYNPRQTLYAWHPKDAAVAFAFGGDWITRSGDGGKHFAWQANGYTGILVGDSFNFNPHYPSLLFFGSQDYNGGVTFDGGDTWRYTNVSGNRWGGHTYGAYAISPEVLVVGATDRWHGRRTLALSRDGGKTWQRTQQTLDGPAVAHGDPRRAKVAFAANLRTGDGGWTWKPMNGCSGVFTASAGIDGTLYGLRGQRTVVASVDGGLTWKTVAEAPAPIEDLAVDHQLKRIYAAVGRKMTFWNGQSWHQFDNLPQDQGGKPGIRSLAVDPQDPAILYAISRRNVFMSDASVIRSADGGQNWEVLTRRTPLETGAQDGGREAVWIRVHPQTREAWVVGGCFGVWKWKP